MVGMARSRDVTCPAGHPFATRANPRVRLRCPVCREWVLAPPVDDPWRGPPGGPDPGADHPGHAAGVGAEDTQRVPPEDGAEVPGGAGPEVPPRSAGGLRVVKAAKTVTGARRSTPRAATAPPERPTETLTPAQQAGRRGGLAPGIARRMGTR